MNDFYINEKDGCIQAVYKGTSRVSFFPLFSGIRLGFNEIRTKELPSDPFLPLFTSKVALRINFSLSGICELQTAGGDYIYVKGGFLSVSRETASRTFFYPSGNYTGIELFVEADAMDRPPEEFERFGVCPEKIENRYLNRRHTLLTGQWSDFSKITQLLYEALNRESPDPEQLRLYALLIFRMLSTGEVRLEDSPVSALTPYQVERAKSAEKLLTQDLSRRITVSELAKQLDVGDSSLKNWFHDVFGKSISEYMRDLRIQEAKQLLSSSILSIAEIADRVGYENQAKFTAMFHKYCGCTPSMYRRQ